MAGVKLSQTEALKLTQKFKCAQRKERVPIQRNRRATQKLAELERYFEQVNSTLKFIEKRAYRPYVRSLVRQIVLLNRPMSSVGAILDCIYQLMIKLLLDPYTRPEKIALDSKTVACIVGEGGVAADIQTALELLQTPGMCKH